MLASMFAAQPALGASIAWFGIDRVAREKENQEELDGSSRILIEARLVELGRDASEAKRLAGLLTVEDLAVLSDNPAMLQEAGAMSAQQRNMMAGLLVLGGLIALAYAADGSINVSN